LPRISFAVHVSSVRIVVQEICKFCFWLHECDGTVADMHLWDCYQLGLVLFVLFLFLPTTRCTVDCPENWATSGMANCIKWPNVSTTAHYGMYLCIRCCIGFCFHQNVCLCVCVCVWQCWCNDFSLTWKAYCGESQEEGGDYMGYMAKGCQAHLRCALFKLLNLLDNLLRKWKLSTDAGKPVAPSSPNRFPSCTSAHRQFNLVESFHSYVYRKNF